MVWGGFLRVDEAAGAKSFCLRVTFPRHVVLCQYCHLLSHLASLLFIIGHWRTGTTLVHELMALDKRHTYPTTYECIDPNHFLLTEKLASRFLRFLLPAQRPMDNMVMGWDRPQEDEFALCNLGQPSPYLTIAFPNCPPQYPEYFDLEDLSPEALSRWKECFIRFLKQVTLRNPKRIVLKSPTHTYRPAGPVSECKICTYCPQPLCGVSFYREPMEIIVQCSWAATSEI